MPLENPECQTCDGTGWVTVKADCKDPDHCVEGAPTSGVHEFEVECPCCAGEAEFDDEDDEDEEE
jgi:hypothetical protein